MLERYALYVIALGAVLGVVGYIWLVVRAFREKVLWGLGLIFFPPAGLIFGYRYFRKAWAPVCVLLLAGGITAASPRRAGATSAPCRASPS